MKPLINLLSGNVPFVRSAKALFSALLFCGIAITAKAQPTISAVSPMVGYTSATVTITGTNFNVIPANNIVYFGATRATVNTASATSLKVTVPVGATYMPVTVNNTATKLTAFSQHAFLPSYNNTGFTPLTVNLDPQVDVATDANGFAGTVIADIDGDGKADLLFADPNLPTFHVYRNTSTIGNISFAAVTTFSVTVSAGVIAVGDIDGDGKPDMVMTTDMSQMSVFRNTSVPGSISFAPQVDFVDPLAFNITVKISDIDKDGKADIVTGNNNSSISVWRNTSVPGTVTFNPAVEFAAGASCYSIAIDDLDGDGKPDIATANNADQTVSMLHNTSATGSISFDPQIVIPAGAGPFKIYTSDLDADGKPELVVADLNDPLSVYLNTSVSGTISMAPATSLALGMQDVAIADMDGNGLPDLSPALTNTFIPVFVNTSVPGTLNLNMTFFNSAAIDAFAVSAGDIDGDGKPDLVTVNNSTSIVSVYRNNPHHPPSFVNGPTQSINICQDAGPVNIDAYLTVNDLDAGETLTWYNYRLPVNAWLTGDGTTAPSGTGVSPTGYTYEPTPGYTGPDTFAVIIYDGVGGIDTTTFYVTVNPTIDPTIDGNQPMCLTGLPVTLTNLTAGGTWSSSNTSVATINSATGVMSPGTVQGTTDITYTNGCGTVMITATVSAAPASLTGSTAVFCSGSMVTLSDATSGGTWNSNNTTIATVDPSTGTVTGNSAGTTTVAYFNGCTSVTTSTVTVRGSGNISGANDICAGGSTTLSGGITSGTWSSNNTTVATINTNTGALSGLTAGTAVITYATGCGVNAVVLITVSTPLTAPAAITGPATLCAGNTITLSDATAGGAWSSSNSAIAHVVSGSFVSGIAAGTATISYTLTNGCGSVSAIYPVTVTPTPVVAPITGSSSIFCEGTSIALNDVTPGGVWSSNITTIAVVSSTGIVTGTGGGNSTIFYTITNSCGSVSSLFIVNVDPLPVIAPITGSPDVCAGSAMVLHDVTAGGTWSSSAPGIAMVSSAGAVTGVFAGTATISYSLSNSCGTASKTKLITVNVVPNPGVIVGLDSVCQGQAITLVNTTPGGVWGSDQPSTAFVSTGGVVTGLTTGIDTIRYYLSNNCGTGMAKKAIKVLSSASAPCTTTGVNETTQQTATLEVFPNPNNGSFTILMSGANNEPATITVTNTLGKLVKELVTTTNQHTAVKVDAAPGIYFISVQTNDGRYNAKVVIE